MAENAPQEPTQCSCGDEESQEEGEERSFEEPSMSEDLSLSEGLDIDEQELPRGADLVGTAVQVEFDGEWYAGTVKAYNPARDQYKVHFADGDQHNDVKWNEMMRDYDGWTDVVPRSFLPIAVEHYEFESVPREYDRISIPGFATMTALQQFFCFLTKKFWQKVVRQSNLYASAHGVDLALTLDELMRWLAVAIIWGIFHNFPSPLRLWSQHWAFSAQAVPRIMSQRRWRTIKQWLHLADNSKDNNTDKFYKVRPMSDEMNRTCAANYHPHRELCIDEMSPQSQHRCTVNKRTKHKKVPAAIDVKALCDGHNGYTIQHRLTSQPPRQIGNLTRTECEVIELVEQSSVKSYAEVFVDNYFTRVSLFEYLYQHFRLYATGTWR